MRGFPDLLSFVTLGDSKTSSEGYQPYLRILLGNSRWIEYPATMSANGRTVAIAQPLIDADLAARDGNPLYALHNFGANETQAMPTEAAFKANYLYILDAVHTKWPNCRQLLMLPGRLNCDTQCNTLAGWITDIVASRSTFAAVGPNEQVFLKGSDNYTTYTADGLHPNDAGYQLTAQQWKLSMGL